MKPNDAQTWTWDPEHEPPESFADALLACPFVLQIHLPETIIEPGRGMVGNAGVIEAEVVLISKKSDADDVRGVYLDIGKFGGLAETMDESIRYPIRTPRDGDALAAVERDAGRNVVRVLEPALELVHARARQAEGIDVDEVVKEIIDKTPTMAEAAAFVEKAIFTSPAAAAFPRRLI